MIKYLYDSLEELLGNILLGAVCFLAVIKICSRYVRPLGDNIVTEFIGSAASWSVEVCTYLFIWMVFVGASLAYKRQQHFAIDFIVEKIGSKYAKYFHISSTILVIVFALIIIWFGGVQTYRGVHIVTPALEMPRSVPYAAVPVGGILILIRAVELLLKQIRGKAEPEQTEEGEPEATAS